MGVGVGTFRQKKICHIEDMWTPFTLHHAHNLYLQIAVERGFFTLGVFLYLILAFLKEVFTVKQKDRYTDKVILGLTAGIMGVLIHGVFDYPFYSQRIALLSFFIVGILITLNRES